MEVEIEYFKRDTILEIPSVTFNEFKDHIKMIEKTYDRKQDNFVDLLCEKFGYQRRLESEIYDPSYVYDRDIEKFYRPV